MFEDTHFCNLQIAGKDFIERRYIHTPTIQQIGMMEFYGGRGFGCQVVAQRLQFLESVDQKIFNFKFICDVTFHKTSQDPFHMWQWFKLHMCVYLIKLDEA